MKSLVLLIIGLLFVCSTVYAANSYYCSQANSYFRMRDIYNPAENCSSFNNDFFGEDVYKECLANIKLAKQKFLQGKCEPIVVKTHVFGACKGEVELAQKSKKVLGYHTSGGDCMENLKSLYANYEY